MNPFRRRLARPALAIAACALVATGCASSIFAPAAANEAEGLAASGRTPRALEPWRDEIIYFVLTDRFADGNQQNNFNVKKSEPWAYHGGDLDGLIGKLDYIKGLGATTIWLTPVNDNRDTSLVDKYWGFHGYWIHGFDKVDEHLGTEATFKRFVDTAHAKGLKVMLDMVVNHVGYDAPLLKEKQAEGWFHGKGDIKNYDDAYQVENHDLAGLPDVNTEHPAVQKYMAEQWGAWVTKYKLDAMRMDTVKHVGMPFWPGFNRAMREKGGADFLRLGEALHGDPNTIGRYTKEGGFDSLFDFPMYYTLTDVFAHGASMRKIGDRLRQDGAYAHPELMSPFLDNHDVPRFMSQAGHDEKKLRLALAFLLTMRGIPTLYQGIEIGQDGAQEPDNRQDMKFGANPALTRYLQSLTALRRDLAPLRRGAMLEMWQDDSVYVFSRLMPNGEEVVCAFNNDTKPQTRDVPVRAESALKDGASLSDRLGASRAAVSVSGGKLHLALGAKEARVLAVTARKRS